MTETRKCIVCGREFKAQIHKKGRKKVYCSNSCRVKASQMGVKVPTMRSTGQMRRVCPICGSVFTADRRKRKYCSVSCAAMGREEQNKSDKAKARQRLYAGPRPPAKKRPVTYAEIRRANLQRGNQDGWRGTPVMGGGGVVNMFSPACQ